MPTDWNSVLLAFLHDPPDKTLSVHNSRGNKRHQHRARELAKAVFSEWTLSNNKWEELFKQTASQVDVLASIVERLPMPEKQNVNVEGSRLSIRHPLSGTEVQLDVPELNDQLVEKEKQQLLACCEFSASEEHKNRNRFFAIWRRWSESLSEVDPVFSRLPAETRNPDHTIWHHLDTTAAFQAATVNGQQPAALLAFALGPVQRFIEASRSVRDLWSSSMILSWLAFRSLLPVIEELGPTAVIYPSLRGNPLLDLWLRNEVGLNDLECSSALRMTPCLPHRFLAVVPWGDNGKEAQDLAQSCRQATQMAWAELASSVREKLSPKLRAHCADWDKRWDAQVNNYFQAEVATIPLDFGAPNDQWPNGDPREAKSDKEIDRILSGFLLGKRSFAEAFPDAEAIRKMIRTVPEDNLKGYRQDHAGRWQYQVELVMRSLAAQRSIRHVPVTANAVERTGRVPQKCSLFGSYEQMGPDDLGESTKFWDRAAQDVSLDGVHIRKGEALSAMALIKRFAAPAFLRRKLDVDQADIRFPDTYTVAGAEWLAKAEIDPLAVRRLHGEWNGQWLYWNSCHDNPDEPECPQAVFDQIKAARRKLGPSPVYYTILKLDGDDLGGWLRGEKSPKVQDVLHPELVSYYDSVDDNDKAGLSARRPVSPALHAAISSALSNFALHAVPEIVARHHGTTIYSGGDDTLILMPTSTALSCAIELRQAYMGDWYRHDGQEHLMMGSKATISAGMVVVHAKDDLRLALQDARAAEEEAKRAGKDAICVRVRRRSGEHASAICSWPFAETVNRWTQAFLPLRDPVQPEKVTEAGASDRWAYHLRGLEATLTGLTDDAIAAEIRRQVNRAEQPTRRRLGEPSEAKEDEKAGEILSRSFLAYRDFFEERKEALTPACRDRKPSAIQWFLTLCQTASFLARGRDQ